MPKVTNAIRITKDGKKRIDFLLTHSKVDDYHKTLLKGIKNCMPKNISKAQCDVLNNIDNIYKNLIK